MWLLTYTAAFSLFAGLLRAKYHDRANRWVLWLGWVAVLGAVWIHVLRHNLGPVGLAALQRSFAAGAFAPANLELPAKPVLLEGETEDSPIYGRWMAQQQAGTQLGQALTFLALLLSVVSVVVLGIVLVSADPIRPPSKPSLVSPVPFAPDKYLVYVWPHDPKRAPCSLAYYVEIRSGYVYVAQAANGDVVGFRVSWSQRFRTENALINAGYLLASTEEPAAATQYTATPAEVTTPSAAVGSGQAYPRHYIWPSTQHGAPGNMRYVVTSQNSRPVEFVNANRLGAVSTMFASESALLHAGYRLDSSGR